jgi:hypothetical protein
MRPAADYLLQKWLVNLLQVNPILFNPFLNICSLKIDRHGLAKIPSRSEIQLLFS